MFTNRRDFLAKTTAVVVGASFATRPIHASYRKKLRIAFIGVGGRGGGNLQSVAQDKDVEVVALCDADLNPLESASGRFPTARKYRDFRELYKQTDDIDAVVVSTPEHSHAYATMPALKQGKHVYCEKPLTHNIAEARLITQAAEQAKVATQMGTQLHSSANFRRVVEHIQSGSIGNVSQVHVWVDRAWGLQSKEDAESNKDIIHILERPSEQMNPPEHLDWDLWIGPAPWRPYHNCYFPGPKWYRWWDFGSGTMSDLGSHWNDMPFWALNLDAPIRIRAEGPAPHPELAPASMIAHYEYPARGERVPVQLTWYQGTYKPAAWHDMTIPRWSSGVLFIGDRGMLLSDYGKHVLLPEDQFREFKGPDPFLRVSPGHHEEWLEACRTGSPTGSPFSYAGPLTEANHLGNVAYRSQSKIEWNASKMQIANNDKASSLLQRKPREGWSLYQ
ncbi:MAG: Gfo/Idh/MocA family oxidoreductase [Pirellulales bacterium]